MYPCSRYFLVPKEKNKILSFHFLPPVPEQTNLAGKRPHNSQNQPKGLSFFSQILDYLGADMVSLNLKILLNTFLF